MRLTSPHSPSRLRSGSCVKPLLIGFIGFVVLVAFVSSQSQKAQQEALAKGDSLFGSRPAEAIASYKLGFPSAGGRKAEILQRIVDHEAEAGNTAEASAWIERGLDENVNATYKSAAARTLMAKIGADRTARAEAKRVEVAAKKKAQEEVSSERDQIRANKNLPRDQLRALLSGRSKQQVLDAMGKPDETQDAEGIGELWYYRNAGVDTTTNRKSFQVQIVFESGTVTTVNFN